MLDSLFMDAIYTDLERIRRINHSVAMRSELTEGPASELRPIDARIIVPSEDIRELAQIHRHAFPRTVKSRLDFIGARGPAGGQLISYLLFDQAYCRALMDLGYRAGRAGKDELVPWLLGV